jgi:excisionase family DNA binding protein
MINDGVELPRLLTVKQAAEVLNIKPDGIRRLIAEGKLPTLCVNGSIRVRTDSIVDRTGGKPKTQNRF